MEHSQDMTIEERLHEAEQRLARLEPRIKPGGYLFILSGHSCSVWRRSRSVTSASACRSIITRSFCRTAHAPSLSSEISAHAAGRLALAPDHAQCCAPLPPVQAPYRRRNGLSLRLAQGPRALEDPAPGDGSWYNRLVPDYTVQWQGIPTVSDWSVDLSKIQTLLLIATLAGALFRFQPFTSLTALALLIISIPTYLAFNWDWAILFLVIGSVSIYLQSRVNAPPGDRPE